MPASRRFPRLTRQQALARAAEKVFESRLDSSAWIDIKTPQERDFGIDYRLEAVEGGQVIGYEFYVQLKGFQAIRDRSRVNVRVKASTVRYWHAKVLPVLLVVVDCSAECAFFQWFDKSVVIPDDERHVTLSLVALEPLHGRMLLHSVEPYFRTLDRSIAHDQTHALFARLHADTMAMTSVMLETVGNLYFPGQEEREPHRYLQHYFDCLSTFLHHSTLYSSHSAQALENAAPQLRSALDALQAIHRSMCKTWQRSGSVETFEVYADRLVASIPTVTAFFIDMSRFFYGWLLRQASLRQAPQPVDSGRM